MGSYRARHHKYFEIEDARDVILATHQAAIRQSGPTPVPARPVASNLVERAAAAVDQGREAAAKPLVGLTPETKAFLNGTSENTFRMTPQARQALDAEIAAVANTSGEPTPAPYVPIRKPGRAIRQLPGTAAPIAATAAPQIVVGMSDFIPIVVDGPIAPPPPDSLADMTLEQLPIGKAPFEFLNGTAGTGKTTLARKLMDLLPPGSCVLAATTGIAAVNLGEGTTINALLGYFDTADLQEKFTTGQLQAQLRRHRGAGLRRIILDEISMMDARQLTIVVRAVQEINQPRRKDLEAMSGDDLEETPEGELPPQLGLTIVGDFAQLSPVPDKDPVTNRPLGARFAFESPEWPLFKDATTRLTKIWRQDQKDFVEALHAVRRGDGLRALQFFTANRFCDLTDQNYDGSTIFAKNVEVDRYNQLRLDALAGPPMTFEARRWGKQRGDWKQIPDVLTLKTTALIMILANERDVDTKKMIYANGDLGELIAQTSPFAVQVRLKRTGEIVDVHTIIRENTIPLGPGRRKELIAADQAHLITKDKKREIVGTVAYMPIRVAYGCTVHKTQGLTLDKVQINIRDGFFKQPGMLFVALSRCRSAEGLRIVGNTTGFFERCKTDPRVLPWL